MNTDTLQSEEIFIKKQVKDLVNGDILLHPIYRSDGLMLIREFKSLSKDLSTKIKHQVHGELPVIVLSPDCDIDTFNINQCYSNKDLIVELREVGKAHSGQIQVSLGEDALFDKNMGNEKSIESPTHSNCTEDQYIDFLCKSNFFSAFEKKLESPHLQLRGKKVKEILIDTISKNKPLLDKLNEIKDYKEILLLHSINTTGIVLMIGLTLELTETDLVDLAISNLLIDISVAQIPKSKFESHLKHNLPKEDFYNLHLSELNKLSVKLPLIRKESILYGVLDHYEHYDGKGYPKGKKGSNISLFGRIINIAQAYDEMVGGYFYNNGVKPIQALKSIWENRESRFDPNIVRIFLDRNSYFKIGENIILSESYQGTILGFTDFSSFPLSPIIQLKDGSIIDTLDNSVMK